MPERAPLLGAGRLPRLVFALVVLALSATFFVAPHPPMIDIPQHAAQVGALNDLLRGESPWAEDVELNLLTPYWVGYGPWLLFAQAMPLTTALGLVLALGFAAFAFAFSALRASYGAPAILDWLALPSFFGFAYDWGMLTFLLAMPVGFAFLVAIRRWLPEASARRGAVVVLWGVALYLSHVLAFAYFCVVAGIQFSIETGPSPRRWLRSGWPFAIFAGLVLIYALRDDALKGTFVYAASSFDYRDGFVERLERLFYYPFSSWKGDTWWLSLSSLFLFAAPWWMGMKPSAAPARFVPFATSLVFWFAVPHYMMTTYLVYERFAILLFPAYALLFDAPARAERSARVRRFASFAFFLVITVLLARPVTNAFFFAREAETFRALVARLPEGKRALSLVYDRKSEVVWNPHVYLHFPLWYAAEKRGFTDFSFAWFHPQVVRFRRERLPEVAPSFEWQPWHFAELRACERYDLLIVRAPHPPAPDFLEGTTCTHRPAYHEGPWYVFSRGEGEAP